MGQFEEHATKVLTFEGGLVDNPRDPGGITKYGISLRAYPHLGTSGIKNLTKDEALEIYRRDYWDPIRGDDIGELSPRLALVVFDTAVHSGTVQAAKLLQSALGEIEKVPHPDGIIGSQTLAALKLVNCERLAVNFLADRALFLTSLKASEEFHRGWMRRLFSL